MSNRLLKVQDAAKILGVSIKTLHRWEKRGVLIPQRTSGSHRRYSEEQLINFKSLKDEKKLHEIKESRFLSYLSKIYKDPSLNPSFSFSELCLSLGPTRQKIIAGFISFLIVSLIGVSLTRVVFPNSLEKFLNGREMAFMQQGNLSAAVLAEQTVNPDFHFNVSIPSLFREDATVSGTLTAPNILYSVLPGLGISISQGQTPTVSNSGVLSFQNQTGQISLTAGTGISISDLTISNNTQLFKTIKTGGTSFSAGSTTDTLEFAAGSGVSLAADTSSKKVTITASNDYGWVDDGTVVRLSTITDTVGIGTITPSATLDLVGTFQYTDGNQGVNKVLASDASGNATWTALGVAGGITGTGTSGYITKFTGASTAGDSIIYDDGTNIGIGTTAPSNLLYVGASGVDNGVTKLYVTGGTELEGGLFANTIQNRGSNDLTFNIDTAGDFAFTNGNVGIGTTAPSALLSVGSTSQFQVSDAGAVTAVGVDSGAGLLQGTGGLTLTGTANINATGTSATSIGNSTGALTLASGGTSAWTNTSGNLTISTATSGTLALTSAGVLNLTSALASGQTTSSAFNFTSSSDLGAADELLQIGDSAANFMTILGNGNVGIGTTEPSARLHVQDDTNTSSDTNLIRLQSVLDAGGTKAITWNDATNEVGRIGLKYDGVSNTVDFVVEDLFNSGYQTATRALTVKGSGNVGIGTTDPSSYKLNVNGTTYLGGATTLGSTLTLGGTLNANNQLIQNLWAIESRTDTNFALRDKKQGAGELEISTAGASPGYADTARILIGGGVAQGSSYVNFKEPIQVDATANSYIQGNVGIGTTAPATFKLEVAGNIGPEDTNTRDLGSADRYFANAYINNLYTGTAGTVGYWSRTGTVLSPATANDTVAIYTGATNTSGNLLNIAYNAGVTLDGSLIGANIDLNDGYVTPTNQSVTGLKVVLPTTINTNDTGEKTLEGMNLGFGNGTGIQQTGAGTTTYSGVHLLLPALTQSEGAGALTANGVLVDTPSAITTNGTANGVKIAASGVNAGSLNGVLISNITGSGGTETALNIGSGWDNVLSVNSTAVIDGSGVVQVAAGGTNLTSYAIGDIIYASGTTTLSSLVTGGAGNDGKILVIAGGLPTWVSSIGGGICADCVLNDPTVVTTQTITPTTDISSLVVRQTTDGTPTKDIFVVASDDYDGADVGTRYFYVDSSGNVSTGGIASQTLTLTPASDTTALTLVGTNVPTANLQYINSKNTQGTIFNLAYGAAATLNGALIGQAIDLSTNVTATDQSVAGLNITLPVVTNTTSTSTYKGLVIAPPVGGGIEQSGAGTTTFSAIDLTLPALTQTAGTLTANGVLVNTPSAITNSGTANGINIVAFGVGAGTLNGINIGAITAGNAAEKAINIGTGWDFGIYSQTTSPSYFAGSVGIGTTAPLSTLDVRGTIENGLVAWWSMDGGTGTTISDQSINSNTGTLGGDGLGTDLPAWITGKFSKALNFDGSDDYVQVANSASIELLHNPLTVEAWIYRRTNSQDWEGIVVKAKAGDPYDGYSLFSMASGVIRARVGDLNYNLDTTSAISNNAWHHVVLRNDGTNYAIYVDGVKASADGTTGTVTTTGTVLWLGRSISAGEYFDGMIDEVRIYNRALSAREIAEHYRQEAPSLAQGGTVSGDLYVMESGSVGIGTTAPAAKMEIASTSTTGGDFLITNTGVGLSGTVAGITANSVTTGDLLTISGTALTTGSGLVMTGPSSTGVTDHFVKITSDVGASSSLIYGAPDFSGSAVTGYGLNITATDATANANTDYGVYSSLALTGNAAKTGVGLYSLLSTASTTADTLVASDLATSTSGIITTGTRSIYGLRTQPVSTAASTGGTTNVYGVYSKAGGVVGAGGIINSYGLYVANGTMDGTGTSTNTGLYVETPTGAGTNYAAIFAGGNVGIGTTDPQALLSVGSTSQFQVSSAGAVTAVGVNSGAGLLQGALGLTITGAAVSLNDSSNFNTTINTGTSTGTVGIGSANAGALTLASGAASSFTVTNNTLTLQTTGTGTLTMALTSAGALNLSAAAASTWTLPAVANALNIDSNTLTIDASNHYVGIGTTGPGEKLEINGNLKFTSSGTISTGNGNLTLGPTGGNVLIPSATVVFWDGNSAGAGAIRFLNEQYLGWRNAGNTDNLTLGVNSNDAFVFSGGNVGIGTTNPSAKLAVSSGSIVIDNGYNIYLNGIAGGALDTNWYLGKDANHNINIAGAPDGTRAFQVLDAGTSAVRLHVEFSGNVGIGTTGPGALLDVRGSAVFNEDSADADFRVESNGNANALTVDANTNNGFGNISFFSAGSDGGLLFMDNAAFTAGNANFGKFRIANANAMTVPSGGALQATVWLEEPNLTLTDTLTDAATLYIGSAPTEATNNYALWVASGNVRFDGSVGIGTTAPGAKLEVNGTSGAGNSGDFILNLQGGSFTESDLYVLNTRDVNTGVGFAAKVIGVNIQNAVGSANQVYLRSNTGGVTSAGAVYLGADNVNQGIFGVLGGSGVAGTELSHLLIVRDNGYVGIGTTDPQALLSVGSTSQFQVSDAGAVTAVGVNSGAGLLQGALGLTVTGATVSLNASSNFATNINTGTSTGAVTIGGTAGNIINIGTDNSIADTIAIGSALDSLAISSSKFVLTSAGAISGVTTLGLSGAISGATATNTINGLIINGSTQTLSANNIADSGALTIATGANGAMTLNPNGTGALIATLDSVGNINDVQLNRSGTLTSADSTADILANRTVVTNSSGSLNDTANFVQFTSNITGTGTDTGSVLGLTQSNSSATGDVLAISNSGTGKDISGTSNTWNISKAGAVTAVGVNSGAGLLQGALGLTITGAAVSLNDSSNFNTTINTGTSTGTVGIGSANAGALTLASGAASSFTVTNANLTLSTTGASGANGVINLTSALAAGNTTTSAFNITASTDLGAADELLQIGDSAGTFLTVLGNGNVGIGTTAPAYALDIVGDSALWQSVYGTDDGLVGYWPFSEGTGTKAYDRSPYGNDGTLTAGPTWASGKYGNALSFDDTDDVVSLSSSDSLDNLSNVTVEAWVKPASQTGSRDAIAKASYASGGLVLRTTQVGNGHFTPHVYTDGWHICDGSTVPTTEWTYLVLTYDGETLIGYFNGEFDCQNTTPSGNFDPNSTTFVIGHGESDFFNGLVDEVRIYNRALSADEIKTHYLRGNKTNTAVAMDTSTTAGPIYGLRGVVTDTGIVTTGTDYTYGSRLDVTRTGATGGTINTYGQYLNLVTDNAGAGGTHNAYGLYVNLDGNADNNYAGIFMGGNVGIGTADTHSNKVEIYRADYGPPVTSGTAQTYGVLRARSGGASLDIGSLSDGKTWLQVGEATNLATNYDMLLQPNGGNVGIGTTAPSALLSVGSTSQFQVSSAGAVTAVGVDSGAGLLQGALGLTVTGAAVSLNDSSNFNTSINTGTSTGTVGIGSANAGTLTLASGAASSFTVTNANLTLSTTGASGANGVINLTSALAAGNTTTSAFNITTSTDLGAADELLQIGDSAGTFLTVLGNGNVGIGTTNPIANLAIGANAGQTGAIGIPNNTAISFRNQANSADQTLKFDEYDYFVFSTNLKMLGQILMAGNPIYGDNAASGDLYLRSTTHGTKGDVILADDGGSVGIGTTAPGSTLDVKGTVRLSGATSGYVGFAPAAEAGSTTYTLPSADGSSGQALTTNGSGTLSWANSTQLVQNFTAESAITAGDVLGVGQSGKVTKGLVPQEATQMSSVAVLDSTHYVVAYNSNSKVAAVVCTVSGTTSTCGNPKVAASGNSYYVSVAALDSTHFVIVYDDGVSATYGAAIVGLTDGANGILSFGSASNFNASQTADETVAMIDSTHFIVAYRDYGNSSYGTAIIGVTDGGTTISSYGASNAFEAASSILTSVAVLDSTHFVVAYKGTSSYGRGIVGVTDGASTISSYGTASTFETDSPTSISVAALDATHFVASYQNFTTPNGKSVIGVTDGATAISSYGTKSSFNAASIYSNTSTAKIDATHFVVAYNDFGNSNYGTAIIGLTDGSTTISSWGSENVFNSYNNNANVGAAVLDSTHFAVAYTNSSNFGASKVALTDEGTTISSYGTQTVLGSYLAGIAKSTVGAGATVPVIISGISNAHSGLTTGAVYYAATDGTLTTTSGSYRVGLAVSATEILVNGNRDNANQFFGDLIFANNFVITEAQGPIEGLILKNQLENSIFNITESGDITTPGTITAAGFITQNADLAEIYASGQVLEPGTLVKIAQDANVPAVEETSQGYDSGLMGVISTQPAITLGSSVQTDSAHPHTAVLALAGRVPVKVSTESGQIKTGDYLTSSSTPGVAMKATKAGPVIGKALEAFDGSNPTISKIMVFVNLSWYDPSIYITMSGDLSTAFITTPIDTINSSLTSSETSTSSAVLGDSSTSTASASAIPQTDLESLTLKVTNLQSDYNLLSARLDILESMSLLNSTSSASLMATTSASFVSHFEDFDANNATISGTLMVLGRTVLTDVGITGDINAGVLKIDGLNGEVDTLSGPLKLQSLGLGGVDILAGKVTIDTEGNVKIAETLTVKKLETQEIKVLGAKSIGSATITPGVTFVEINSPVASESSRIFLTPTTLTSKQLNVTEKGSGKFKVEIAQAESLPIDFDWWIVNTE